MLIQEARKYLNKGIVEVAGSKSHPQILEWIKKTEKLHPTDTPQDDSAYSWCGVFCGNMCLNIGVEPPPLFQRATSWSTWGQEVKFNDRKPGDIMVVRTGRNRFHVTFYEQDILSNNLLQGLGGNQGNKVSRAPYAVRNIVALRRN